MSRPFQLVEQFYNFRDLLPGIEFFQALVSVICNAGSFVRFVDGNVTVES